MIPSDNTSVKDAVRAARIRLLEQVLAEAVAALDSYRALRPMSYNARREWEHGLPAMNRSVGSARIALEAALQEALPEAVPEALAHQQGALEALRKVRKRMAVLVGDAEWLDDIADEYGGWGEDDE